MTKAECLAALAAKMTANRAEVKRQLEHIASLPGHQVTEDGTDLLKRLSETWKEGAAVRELAMELVGIVYDEPAQVPPEARPS